MKINYVNTMISKNKILIVGHAGGKKTGPENSF